MMRQERQQEHQHQQHQRQQREGNHRRQAVGVERGEGDWGGGGGEEDAGAAVRQDAREHDGGVVGDSRNGNPAPYDLLHYNEQDTVAGKDLVE